MSWPHLRSATLLRLPAPQKLVALALGDLADGMGVVSVSNARLQAWTGLAECTVRRALAALMRSQHLELVDAAVRETQTPARYRVRTPGLRVTPAQVSERDLPQVSERDLPGITLAPGAGIKEATDQVSQRYPLPKRSSQEQDPQAAAAPPPLEHADDEPTVAHVTKFALELLAENSYPVRTLQADLNADVKSMLKQRGFDYDTPDGRAAVQKGLDSAITQYWRQAAARRS